MSNAWHLRNDGKAFPVTVHVYPMQDENLASEAEVASFIIATDSQDQEYAKYVLDAFMALQIENIVSYDANEENIDSSIMDALAHLPFKFAYPLENGDMLEIHKSQNNFHDIDSLYDFIDEVRDDLENIWITISESFNQQFCRVRYGGQFNSQAGNNGIWFRIASVGYNWDNVIYTFASEMRKKLNIEYITICRDPESDYGDQYIDESTESYFYKAKDGTAYYYMPIDEFFTEEHEKNPVFSSTDIGAGVIYSIRKELAKGKSLLCAYDKVMSATGVDHIRDYRPKLLRNELNYRCISASQWFDELNTRTKMKLSKMKNAIKQDYPEIIDMDIDFQPRENRNGNPVGFELICTLMSDHPQIDNQIVSIVSTKSLSSTMADRLVSLFKREYDDFLEFANIRL